MRFTLLWIVAPILFPFFYYVFVKLTAYAIFRAKDQYELDKSRRDDNG
jgi:hypothetical protein